MVLLKIEICPKGKNGSLAARFKLRSSPRSIRPCTSFSIISLLGFVSTPARFL